MNWTTTLMSLASGLVIAAATSLLTVRLARRRFYSEKWWERKSAAYTAIIESMHHLREHADTHLTFEIANRKLPADGEENLDRNLRQAMADLRRHRDVGSFVISEDATAALNAVLVDLEESAKASNWIEYLDYRVGALDRALQEMRRLARKDLSLT